MDISKVTDDEKVRLCKWYFKAGFALLPLVWAINVVWFAPTAFKDPGQQTEQQKEIKKYVILSGIGALIWLIITAVWVSIFQIYRSEWGEFSDQISFIIPLGKV